MNRSQILLVAISTLLVVPCAANGQIDQRSIADDLRAAHARTRSDALERVERAQPTQIGPDLRRALFEGLQRENAVVEQRRLAGRRGEVVPPLEDPGFHSRIIRVVVALKDPATITALSQAVGTGGLVPQALAEFGEAAAPAVLAVVNNPAGEPELVDGGLLALRLMLEGRNARPLSARTMTEIRNAAERRLATGEGLFITTLWRAIDLAIVSGDAALRRTVEAVASDYGEGLRRGIKDVDLIRKTQQRATERLAGVPPLPRPGMPKGSP